MDLLSAKSFHKLDELAQKLRVSVSTARREIDSLQNAGVVQRTHGGVRFLGDKKALPFFVDRQNTMAKEKNLIGKFAAKLVTDGESVIIDGGTTPYQVAMNLQNKNIQVVTNSLPVTSLFADANNVQLINTGGTLYPGTGVFLGPSANDTLKNIHVQKAFIGVAGITDQGLYNSNSLLVETEKYIIESSDEVFVVTDRSKFERHSLAFLCDFSKITAIITNASDNPTKLEQKLIKKNIKIIYV